MKLTLIMILTIGILQSACTQEAITYSIKRTDYVHGTHKNYEYVLRNDSVLVTYYSMNNKPAQLIHAEALTSHQKSNLQGILKDFKLSEMKTEYIDELVEGEGNSVYDITINGESKSIYVYYVEVPQLKMLDAFFYEIVPPID